MSANSSGKRKLRTAADVISRLRWSEEFDSCQIMIGYDDRIHGPMEKCLVDYTPIDLGGDIPEHRIQYFRRQVVASSSPTTTGNNTVVDEQNSILWDRQSRIDRLFIGSGQGGDGSIIPRETLDRVQQAMSNMERITEEREIFKQEKAKRKARQRKLKVVQAATAAAANSTTTSPPHTETGTTTTDQSNNYLLKDYGLPRLLMQQERHIWQSIEPYIIGQEQQPELQADRDKDSQQQKQQQPQQQQKQQQQQQYYTFVTWNVLYDIDNDQDHDDDDDDSETNEQVRWKQLMDCLLETNADIIALQEVSPNFVQLLFEHATWVGEKYASSASPTNTSTVTPTGKLLLWKKQSFQLLLLEPHNNNNNNNNLFVCRDFERNRSIVAALQSVDNPNMVLLVSNVHLPADGQKEFGNEEKQYRKIARRRELTAIIAKLESLELRISGRNSNNNKRVCSVLLGDFNCRDGEFDMDLSSSNSDGSSAASSFFVDTWSKLVAQNKRQDHDNDDNIDDNNGFTYDPISNPRAAVQGPNTTSNTTPRRIDRIYIGNCCTTKTTRIDPEINSTTGLRPVQGKLLGADCSIPPSDHYGVLMTLESQNTSGSTAAAAAVTSQGGTTFGTTAVSSSSLSAFARFSDPVKDSLLALALDQKRIGETTDICDRNSTLPLPHITMLNGFVDLSSQESRFLAKRGVENAVGQFLASKQHSDGSLSLSFGPESLSVFEHRNSATLVCVPDENNELNQWIHGLYACLRETFPHCDEQESRFHGGWQPHLSLSSFGTAADARKEIAEKKQNQAWIQSRQQVKVQGLVLYRRSVYDGMFYAVSSVPLCQKPRDFPLGEIRSCLVDAGSAMSDLWRGMAGPVVSEIKRACQIEARALLSDHKFRVIPFGSQSLEAALPVISDIDLVLEIRPAQSGASASTQFVDSDQLLANVANRLRGLYSEAKVRLRRGTASEGVLKVLTIKLWPQAPSVDLMLDLQDTAITNSGTLCSDILRQAVQNAFHGLIGLDVMSAFAGALRILKLWAYRRSVYGASLGYLGGGGFSIFLAQTIIDGLKAEENVKATFQNCTTEVDLSRAFVKCFFQRASRWTSPRIVCLPDSSPKTVAIEEEIRKVTETVLTRETMGVIDPASGGNFGRNATRSTTQALVAELQRAASLLQACEPPTTTLPECIFDPLAYESFLIDPYQVLFLEVQLPDASAANNRDHKLRIADVKAWASKQTLSLLVSLEHHHQIASEIRPLSRPIKTKNNKFFFVLRVRTTSAHTNDLDTFAGKRQVELQNELRDAVGGFSAAAELIPSDYIRIRSVPARDFVSLLK